jgi:hypothetical protein
MSVSAFYIRQLYAFLPAIAAWTVLTRTKTPRYLVLSVFFLAALPELFLIYVWKGINPPQTHFVFHPAMVNILRAGAIVGMLSIPIVLGCIRRSLGDVLPQWWGSRSTVIVFAGLLVFVILLWATEWPEEGGGIIVKAGLSMGALGNPFILTMSYFGLVSAAVFSMRSATNAVLAGTYLGPLFVTIATYQHYFEPSLAVTLFLFADTQIARTVFNKRVLLFNVACSVLILAAGIVYYNFLHPPR